MTKVMSMPRRVIPARVVTSSTNRFQRRRVAPARYRNARARAAGFPAPAAGRMAARFCALFALGALVEYFILDRRHAARRRQIARERGRAVLRRRARDAARRAKYVEGVAQGTAYKAAHAVPGVGGHKPPVDDVTLAQKVESIAFREARVPKDHVNVNAENGVISLRGLLEDGDQIARLVRATEAIEGVEGVKILLHTPDPSAKTT
jgi:hypothetical protein